MYLSSSVNRLGPNFANLQVNKPIFQNKPHIRDGDCATPKNGGVDANYFPNSIGWTMDSLRDHSIPGKIKDRIVLKRYNMMHDDNYSQVIIVIKLRKIMEQSIENWIQLCCMQITSGEWYMEQLERIGTESTGAENWTRTFRNQEVNKRSCDNENKAHQPWLLPQNSLVHKGERN